MPCYIIIQDFINVNLINVSETIFLIFLANRLYETYVDSQVGLVSRSDLKPVHSAKAGNRRPLSYPI